MKATTKTINLINNSFLSILALTPDGLDKPKHFKHHLVEVWMDDQANKECKEMFNLDAMDILDLFEAGKLDNNRLVDLYDDHYILKNGEADEFVNETISKKRQKDYMDALNQKLNGLIPGRY